MNIPTGKENENENENERISLRNESDRASLGESDRTSLESESTIDKIHEYLNSDINDMEELLEKLREFERKIDDLK